MKKIYYAFFILFMLIGSLTAGNNKHYMIEALSSWTNQSGSTLYINSVDNNGLFSGTYINREAGYRCQNIPYPVTGWIYGTAITFTTKWASSSESCNSITAWTGFLYQGKIYTLWQLVSNGSSSTSQIIEGSDTFSPSDTNTHKSLIPKK